MSFFGCWIVQVLFWPSQFYIFHFLFILFIIIGIIVAIVFIIVIIFIITIITSSSSFVVVVVVVVGMLSFSTGCLHAEFIFYVWKTSFIFCADLNFYINIVLATYMHTYIFNTEMF